MKVKIIASGSVEQMLACHLKRAKQYFLAHIQVLGLNGPIVNRHLVRACIARMETTQ